jgi:hypothetical protein
MASSPDASSESAGENQDKKRWRLYHLTLPTPVVATVVGVVLSALLSLWLIPAFTRQWDDRQKAHDLKAALIAEMATASAQAWRLARVAFLL